MLQKAYFWNIFCFKAMKKSVSKVGLAYIYIIHLQNVD